MRALSLHTLVILSLARGALAQQAPAPAPPPPPPQPAPKKAATLPELDGRVTRLSADVEELKKLTVELPTLQRTVNDISAQLTALKQEVETFRKVNQAEMDERARLDQLDRRITVLSQQVSGMRSELQAQGAPEASSPFGAATYKEGFLLATQDGAFSLRIKSYLQLRYLLRTAESDAGDVEESSIFLRRARLIFDGTAWSPRLGYKLMADFGQGNVRLLDFTIEGKLHDLVSLRGGQFKNPFSRNFVNSADQLSFVERPIATEEFRYDRDIGLMAIVKPHPRIEANLALFNGAGPNVRANDNIDPLIVARVQGAILGMPWKAEEGDPDNTPSPALLVGASGSFENTPAPTEYGYREGMPAAQAVGDEDGLVDVDGDGEHDNVRVMQLALDVAFRWRGLGVEGEAYFRQEDWGTIGQGQTPPFTPNEAYQGGFVQATYFLQPGRYQLGARAAFAEVSPLSIGGKRRSTATCSFAGVEEECTLPLSDLRTELTVMAAYYRHRHGIELTAMYSFLDWATRDGMDPVDAGEHRFVVESQLSF
jgi:hypothetical protein